jgi:hypothetical protein
MTVRRHLQGPDAGLGLLAEDTHSASLPIPEADDPLVGSTISRTSNVASGEGNCPKLRIDGHFMDMPLSLLS